MAAILAQMKNILCLNKCLIASDNKADFFFEILIEMV